MMFRAAAVTVSACALGVSVLPAADAAEPSAVHFGGQPAVGALFIDSTASGVHTCTASVLASATHDTIITAAHCIVGNGSAFTFAPGYARGAKPYGVWHVARTYVDPSWTSRQDPAHDVAVLKLSKKRVNGRWQGVQDVTRRAYTLSYSPYPNTPVRVEGYVAGAYDLPIRCDAKVYYTNGSPSFDCDGFLGGVSGSAFVVRWRGKDYVTGVIGGPNQGGCEPSTSYSSRFTGDQRRLLWRAETNRAGDWLPLPAPDGC